MTTNRKIDPENAVKVASAAPSTALHNPLTTLEYGRHKLIEHRIAAYKIDLGASKPAGAYVSLVEDRGTVEISGMTPSVDGVVVYAGRAGAEVSIDDARRAAEIGVLRCLRALRDHLGDLGRIRRVTKLNVFLQAAPGFTAIGDVSNAASELLNHVLAPNGAHARTTIAAAMLPRNAVLELDMTVTIDPAT